MTCVRRTIRTRATRKDVPATRICFVVSSPSIVRLNLFISPSNSSILIFCISLSGPLRPVFFFGVFCSCGLPWSCWVMIDVQHCTVDSCDVCTFSRFGERECTMRCWCVDKKMFFRYVNLIDVDCVCFIVFGRCALPKHRWSRFKICPTVSSVATGWWFKLADSPNAETIDIGRRDTSTYLFLGITTCVSSTFLQRQSLQDGPYQLSPSSRKHPLPKQLSSCSRLHKHSPISKILPKSMQVDKFKWQGACSLKNIYSHSFVFTVNAPRCIRR